jgi:vitamin B12 transporter
LQDPRDNTTGLVLQRRAKEFASVAANHDFDALNVGAEVHQSGVRQDGAYTLSAYSLLNLTSRYTINKHFNVTATAGNVFNRDYSEAYSYNTLGRTLFVGLNYQQ